MPSYAIEVGEAAIVNVVDRSRHVEYFAIVFGTSYSRWSVATSHRPKRCMFQPAVGFARETVWTTASS